jgi:hypothetical protein
VRNPLCEKLGIDVPIFAFTHCRDVVVAVSRAGGFGVLGAAYFSPDELKVELDWIDAHIGDQPYGIDILLPQNPDQLATTDPVEILQALTGQFP